MGRTFEHNGHTRDISLPHLTDKEMADSVRMLMRGDLDHEMVCCGARDRIMCLMHEKAQLLALLKEILPNMDFYSHTGQEWLDRRDKILKDMKE